MGRAHPERRRAYTPRHGGGDTLALWRWQGKASAIKALFRNA